MESDKFSIVTRSDFEAVLTEKSAKVKVPNVYPDYFQEMFSVIEVPRTTVPPLERLLRRLAPQVPGLRREEMAKLPVCDTQPSSLIRLYECLYQPIRYVPVHTQIDTVIKSTVFGQEKLFQNQRLLKAYIVEEMLKRPVLTLQSTSVPEESSYWLLDMEYTSDLRLLTLAAIYVRDQRVVPVAMKTFSEAKIKVGPIEIADRADVFPLTSESDAIKFINSMREPVYAKGMANDQRLLKKYGSPITLREYEDATLLFASINKIGFNKVHDPLLDIFFFHSVCDFVAGPKHKKEWQKTYLAKVANDHNTQSRERSKQRERAESKEEESTKRKPRKGERSPSEGRTEVRGHKRSKTPRRDREKDRQSREHYNNPHKYRKPSVEIQYVKKEAPKETPNPPGPIQQAPAKQAPDMSKEPTLSSITPSKTTSTTATKEEAKTDQPTKKRWIEYEDEEEDYEGNAAEALEEYEEIEEAPKKSTKERVKREEKKNKEKSSKAQSKPEKTTAPRCTQWNHILSALNGRYEDLRYVSTPGAGKWEELQKICGADSDFSFVDTPDTDDYCVATAFILTLAWMYPDFERFRFSNRAMLPGTPNERAIYVKTALKQVEDICADQSKFMDIKKVASYLLTAPVPLKLPNVLMMLAQANIVVLWMRFVPEKNYEYVAKCYTRHPLTAPYPILMYYTDRTHLHCASLFKFKNQCLAHEIMPLGTHCQLLLASVTPEDKMETVKDITTDVRQDALSNLDYLLPYQMVQIVTRAFIDVSVSSRPDAATPAVVLYACPRGDCMLDFNEQQKQWVLLRKDINGKYEPQRPKITSEITRGPIISCVDEEEKAEITQIHEQSKNLSDDELIYAWKCLVQDHLAHETVDECFLNALIESYLQAHLNATRSVAMLSATDKAGVKKWGLTVKKTLPQAFQTVVVVDLLDAYNPDLFEYNFVPNTTICVCSYATALRLFRDIVEEKVTIPDATADFTITWGKGLRMPIVLIRIDAAVNQIPSNWEKCLDLYIVTMGKALKGCPELSVSKINKVPSKVPFEPISTILTFPGFSADGTAISRLYKLTDQSKLRHVIHIHNLLPLTFEEHDKLAKELGYPPIILGRDEKEYKQLNMMKGISGHAVLRFVLNNMTALLYARCFSEPTSAVYSIGGNISEREFLPDGIYHAIYRPADEEFDKAYYQRHRLAIEDHNSVGMPHFVEAVNGLTCFESPARATQLQRVIVAIDSLYYPGVKECISQHLIAKFVREALVIYQHYDILDQPYNDVYLADNGHYSVILKNGEWWVKSSPNGNDKTYFHPIIPGFLNSAPQPFEWEGLMITPLVVARTALHSCTVLARVRLYDGSLNENPPPCHDATRMAHNVDRIVEKYLNSVAGKIVTSSTVDLYYQCKQFLQTNRIPTSTLDDARIEKMIYSRKVQYSNSNLMDEFKELALVNSLPYKTTDVRTTQDVSRKVSNVVDSALSNRGLLSGLTRWFLGDNSFSHGLLRGVVYAGVGVLCGNLMKWQDALLTTVSAAGVIHIFEKALFRFTDRRISKEVAPGLFPKIASSPSLLGPSTSFGCLAAIWITPSNSIASLNKFLGALGALVLLSYATTAYDTWTSPLDLSLCKPARYPISSRPPKRPQIEDFVGSKSRQPEWKRQIFGSSVYMSCTKYSRLAKRGIPDPAEITFYKFNPTRLLCSELQPTRSDAYLNTCGLINTYFILGGKYEPIFTGIPYLQYQYQKSLEEECPLQGFLAAGTLALTRSFPISRRLWPISIAVSLIAIGSAMAPTCDMVGRKKVRYIGKRRVRIPVVKRKPALLRCYYDKNRPNALYKSMVNYEFLEEKGPIWLRTAFCHTHRHHVAAKLLEEDSSSDDYGNLSESEYGTIDLVGHKCRLDPIPESISNVPYNCTAPINFRPRVIKSIRCFTQPGAPLKGIRELGDYLETIRYDPMWKKQVIYNPGLEPPPFSESQAQYGSTDPINIYNCLFTRTLGASTQVDDKKMQDYLRAATPIVNKKVRELKEILAVTDLPTIQDYIDGLPDAAHKREYQLSYEESSRYCPFSKTLEVMVKLQEGQYKNPKLRFVMSPKRRFKAILGWYNKVLITLMKKVTPGFVHGLTVEELEEKMAEMVRSIPNGVNVAWDTDQYDSTQYRDLRENIDNKICRELIDDICDKGAIPAHYREVLHKHFENTEFTLVFYYPQKRRNKQPMFIAKIVGITPSGDQSSTTFGNTSREDTKIEILSFFAEVPQTARRNAEAGDDTQLRIQREFLKKFLEVCTYFMGVFGIQHAPDIGQNIKSFNIHPTNFDFLSKIGTTDGYNTFFLRQLKRVFAGGNFASAKAIENCGGPIEYNTAVTQGLIAQHSNHPALEAYVNFRRADPRLMNPKAQIKMISREFRYSLKCHSRTHQSNLVPLLQTQQPFDPKFYSHNYTYHLLSSTAHQIVPEYKRIEDIPEDLVGRTAVATQHNIDDIYELQQSWGFSNKNPPQKPQHNSSSPELSTITAPMSQPNDQEGIKDPGIIKSRVNRARQFKNNLKSRVEALQREIAQLKAPFGEKKTRDLAKIYADPQSDQHELLMNTIQELRDYMEPLRNIRTKYLKTQGMTFADKNADKNEAFNALMEVDAKKMGKEPKDVPGEIRKLQLELKSMGIEGISNSVLRDLVALDDWSTVWNVAKPMLATYGLPILKDLYKRYVHPKIQSWVGGDEGLDMRDYSNDPLRPSKQQYIAGLNKEVPGVTLPRPTNLNAVSTHYLKSVVCPESYVHRATTKFPQKVSLASATVEYTVSVNSNGDAGIYIFSSANVLTADSLLVANANTFNPDTSTNGASLTKKNGPLATSYSSIKMGQLVSSSVTITPIISYNSAGSVRMAYYQRLVCSGEATYGTPTITPNDLAVAPFYVTGNARNVYRMISVPSDTTADGFSTQLNVFGTSTSYSADDVYCVLLTGFAASVPAVKVTWTAVLSFIPNNSAIPICPMAYPQSGPMSNEAIQAMFGRFPVIQSLTLNDAKKLATALPDYPISFEECEQVISATGKTFKPREAGVIEVTMPQIKEDRDLELPNMSEDFKLISE